MLTFQRSPFGEHGKMYSLLVSLFVLIVLYPYLEGSITGQFILSFLLTVSLITAVYTIGYDKRHIIISLCLALPAFIANWVGILTGSHITIVLSLVLSLLFYGYVTNTIMRYVIGAEKVTADLIFGAISVYLLLGFIFGVGFGIIEEVSPSSFVSTHSEVTPGTLFYYSFTTLTTTGYGDITPVSYMARSFAVIEMIIGVLFVAVFIARLVGSYAPQRRI